MAMRWYRVSLTVSGSLSLGLTPPQVTDGGDDLHARWTAANINNGTQPKIHTHPGWTLTGEITILAIEILVKVKVKWSRYRPGVAQRVGRGTALLFHDHGTKRGWVVSRTPRPHFTPGKDTVPILQEAGWAPGPVWTGGKSSPNRDSIPNRPACSQLLYWLSYLVHIEILVITKYYTGLRISMNSIQILCILDRASLW